MPMGCSPLGTMDLRAVFVLRPAAIMNTMKYIDLKLLLLSSSSLHSRDTKCTVILVMGTYSLSLLAFASHRWDPCCVLCSSDNIWNDPSLDLDTDLPSGWRTIRDSTGTYYWHVPTGTTQWQHPSYSNEEDQSAVNGVTATDLKVRVSISKHSSVLLFDFGCFILGCDFIREERITPLIMSHVLFSRAWRLVADVAQGQG
jgi:hypothetical protein